MDDIIYDKLSSLSQISKVQLAKILNSNPNKKDLTLEPNIIKPLERICGVSWLKTNGVEKIFILDATLSYQQNIQFYMIYTNIRTFHKVLQHIQSLVDVNNPEVDKFHIICVPKSLYAFEQAIEENALWNIVKLYSFQWLPVHLDKGILSLEIPNMFKDIFVYENYTILPSYAKSLWHFFLAFGKPNFCLSLGQHAQIIMKQLDTMLKGATLEESEFGGLIIIDRNVDYASALLTPGSYSALLNEIYGISCGVCKEEKASTEVPDIDDQCNKIIHKQPVNFVLDCKKDMIYKLIKDKYFTEVTDILRVVTKDLKVQGQTSEMALDEMKRYVQTKLQSVAQKKQMVACHLNAAETIVKFLHDRLEKLIDVESNILLNNSKGKNFTALEELLQTDRDPHSSLALFLLLCVTQKVTDTEVKSFLLKYFMEFGYNLGFLYRNLVKANFIENVSNSKFKLQLLNKTNFYSNANKLRQIISEPEKVNLKNPSCCSYVFGGTYVPLIAQISSSILCGTPIDDIKEKLQNISEVNMAGQYQNSKKNLLVYIIGGITFSEIAALNLLESTMGVKIVKISDKIISKNDIANAFITL